MKDIESGRPDFARINKRFTTEIARRTATMPLDDPGKAEALQGHMSAGAVIGVLLLMRFLTRRATTQPPAADSGTPALRTAARAGHIGLCILIAAMVGSGLAMTYGYGLIDIVFTGSDDPIPADLRASLPDITHKIIGF